MQLKNIVRRLRISSSKVMFLVIIFTAVAIRNFALGQDDDDPSGPSGPSGPSDIVPYPTYHTVPRGLPFSCTDRIPGYYADPDTQCQVWHWCVPSGQRYSFLCPNGTVFNQAFRVCDWFYNVNCPQATSLYSINEDLYKDSEGNLIKG